MQDNEPTLGAVRKLGTRRFIYLFIIIFFFSVLCMFRGKRALCTQTKIVENTTLMVTQTRTRQLVLDQHNKLQSHHVSKLNLRKRKTKSLSGWKLKCCRSSEKLTIR